MQTTIAIITDIHGNSAALQAVLSDIQNNMDVDHVYCLGDMIAIGHETNEVLNLLLSCTNISFIPGNHELAVLQILEGLEPDSRGEEREHHIWIANQLDQAYIPFLKSLPLTLERTIFGKRFLFTHYHLDEQKVYMQIDKSPTADGLDTIYHDADVDAVCFGHHHILHQFKGKHKLYFNPGSVGCHAKPIAVYGLVSIHQDGAITSTVREVSYDKQHFLHGYSKREVPAAELLIRAFHGG